MHRRTSWLSGGASGSAGQMLCTIATRKSFTLANASSGLWGLALTRAHLGVTELLHSGHVGVGTAHIRQGLDQPIAIRSAIARIWNTSVNNSGAR